MRENINDLLAFVAVASDQSFTRAAARLGTSQSALSRTIRRLEEQIGVRLLTRTTRGVSPTEAGARLLHKVGPQLDEIAAELSSLSDLRQTPAGTVRINCPEQAARFLWASLAKALPAYPDIRVEIFVDQSLINIAAEKYDAGVRLGENLDKDMIAVRVSPDGRLIAVGAPSYFERRAVPETPHDLAKHVCINKRLATAGDLHTWEFEKDGRVMRVRVDGQLTFNTSALMIEAALAGFGIALIPEDVALPYLRSGQLLQVLDDWCPPITGFHLYYPSRRQNTLAFQIVVDALRYRP